jgi:branched-chain amino acid transport system ATP-binding protein
MLEIRKLNFAYGDLQVLWDIDLDVRQGEIVSVVGPNGAGKSTMLRNVSQLLNAQSGSIRFDGVELIGEPAHRVVELGLIHVPEARRIFAEMTVLENLLLGSHVPSARADRHKNLERVFGLFPRLAERRAQLGGTMSGGEQQMLAIGRGLMGNPKLMLLDEPSLGLAPLLVKSVFEIVRTINAQGTTVLLLEQNVYQSLRIAHRGYVIENGRVVLSGTGQALLNDAHVKTAFLGL